MIIDENGKVQTWKAVYARYHRRYEEDCDSLKEARAYLRNGEDYGALSSIHIVDPDGNIIEYDYVGDTDGEEADDAVTDLVKQDHKPNKNTANPPEDAPRDKEEEQ